VIALVNAFSSVFVTYGGKPFGPTMLMRLQVLTPYISCVEGILSNPGSFFLLRNERILTFLISMYSLLVGSTDEQKKSILPPKRFLGISGVELNGIYVSLMFSFNPIRDKVIR